MSPIGKKGTNQTHRFSLRVSFDLLLDITPACISSLLIIQRFILRTEEKYLSIMFSLFLAICEIYSA